MTFRKNTTDTKGFRIIELIINFLGLVVMSLIILATIIRGAEIGFLWRGFWGSVMGGIAGYIIGFFAVIGMVASTFFIVWIFMKCKSKNNKSETQ